MDECEYTIGSKDFFGQSKIFFVFFYFVFRFCWFISLLRFCYFSLTFRVFVTHGSLCPVGDQGRISGYARLCPKSLLEPQLSSILISEPNFACVAVRSFRTVPTLRVFGPVSSDCCTLRVFVSGHFGLLLHFACLVRSFRTAFALGGLLSGRFGLLSPFPGFCPVVSDCSRPLRAFVRSFRTAFALRELLSCHFGLFFSLSPSPLTILGLCLIFSLFTHKKLFCSPF